LIKDTSNLSRFLSLAYPKNHFFPFSIPCFLFVSNPEANFVETPRNDLDVSVAQELASAGLTRYGGRFEVKRGTIHPNYYATDHTNAYDVAVVELTEANSLAAAATVVGANAKNLTRGREGMHCTEHCRPTLLIYDSRRISLQLQSYFSFPIIFLFFHFPYLPSPDFWLGICAPHHG
jgi:hypothetical protein